MAFQIPGIDLNPMAGDSFMGLTRNQAKKLATFFLFIGLILALPPFIPDPVDILSIWAARQIEVKYHVPFITAMLSTYMFGILLFLLGAWIYPYNTQSLLSGYITKLKLFIKKSLRNPKYILIVFVVFILIYNWYANQLGGVL